MRVVTCRDLLCKKPNSKIMRKTTRRCDDATQNLILRCALVVIITSLPLMLLLFLFCLSKTRLSRRRRLERSHTHARARSVILRKRVPTLRALVKHSLSLVRASQLHGVKIQSLVFTLGTLFVHRRALSRHLLLRPDLGPVRVLSLDAVMKLKVRRSRDELSLAVSERCARERVEIERQSPETPAAAATPKSPSTSSPRRARLRPTPRARRSDSHRACLSLSRAFFALARASVHFSRAHLHRSSAPSHSPSTTPSTPASTIAGSCRTARKIRSHASRAAAMYARLSRARV